MTKAKPKITVKNTVMPGRNGGTLRVGNPGHDGSNAGRRPDEVKAYIEAALASPECKETFEAILKRGGRLDPKLWLQTFIASMTMVKSKPPVQLEGGDVSRPLRVVLLHRGEAA